METDTGLKNKAYLEGQRLKNAGFDNELILARLEKSGVPEELAIEVVRNLAVQQLVDNHNCSKPFYNIALVRIGIGILLAVISILIVPNIVWMPIIFITSGIISALLWKKHVL